MFKGGTSLLLHLPEARRLSRDIDIVCGRPAAEVDAVLAKLASREPFLRHEEEQRGVRGLPQRRHFRFFYRSVLPGAAESEVLLDIVEESHEVHEVVMRPIRTNFLTPEREILVRVPTVESLLGDKLTAFAPHTTGVPFHAEKSGGEQLQQVAKQLFDVGVLFEEATDFNKIAATYDAVQAQESAYRATNPSREATLDDTFTACLALTATKQKILSAYPDAMLLHDGLDKMRGHLTWPEFTRGKEPRRLLAARVAVLVAHLRAGRSLDLVGLRYTGSAVQLEALKVASLNGHAHSWLDGLKAVNPEAYHYWHLGLNLPPPSQP
ncbi:MAG: nucleotidyl transferase AbiEii/AbiGii toxin family protein [Opitutaceae bacterium]|nr:nucleotidyl transferase AbiEii/AbiGii toxin family protein [Opitutaceae bacterium]